MWSKHNKNTAVYCSNTTIHFYLGWNSNMMSERGQQVEEMLAPLPLSIANVTSDAYRKMKGTSHVDVTIVGDSLKSKLMNWKYLLIPSCSDHNYIYFQIDINSPRFRTNNNGIQRLPRQDQVDQNLLGNILAGIIDDYPYELNTADQIDAAIHSITSQVQEAILKSKSTPTNIGFIKKMPWMNKEIYALRNKTRLAAKKFYEEPNESNRKINRELEAEYQREIRTAKWEHFKTFCKDGFDQDPYGTIKKMIKHADYHQITELLMNDRTLNEPEDIAKALAESFFPQLEELCDPALEEFKMAADDFLLTHNTPQEAPLITVEELMNALKNCKGSKAPGHDGIQYWVLKRFSSIFAPALVKIFNACLKIQYFPSVWKKAVVLTIKKPNKENYKLASSFRPISLLPCIGKLLEKILNARMKWLAQKFEWFAAAQHGFRENRSTITATSSLVSKIENGFAKPFCACVR